MNIATEALLFDNWTLRVRKPTQNPAGILIALHGVTGDENSLFPAFENFSNDYWIITPRAPYKAPQGGNSWRDTNPANPGWSTFDELKPSATALVELADKLVSNNVVSSDHVSLVGFSQGAALTYVTASLYPDKFNKFGILSGFIPKGCDVHLDNNSALNQKEFFIAHGHQDEIVSMDYATKADVLLKKNGAQVTFCEFQGGHQVDGSCLQKLELFLK